MPALLKIRTDSGHDHFVSMLDEGPDIGESFTWGSIGPTSDYRSAGDFNFVRDGGLTVGDLVVARERKSQRHTYFVGLMKVTAIAERSVRGQPTEFTPRYEMIERFDGSSTLDQLRAGNPKLAALPHFQKNAKGYMLRSFTPLTNTELDIIMKAVRASMP